LNRSGEPRTESPAAGCGAPRAWRRLLPGPRGLARMACLVAACAALVPFAEFTRAAVLVPSMSPWMVTASLLATRAFQATMGLGLAVGVIAMLRRRWFCRWMCPTGLCADGASRLGRAGRSGIGLAARRGQSHFRLRENWDSPQRENPDSPHRENWDSRSEKLDIVRRALRPVPRMGRNLWKRAGQWIAVVTLGGAALGYPLLVWLDPLGLLTGLFSLFGPNFGPATYWSAVGLPAILLLSLLLPGVWCGRLCPLGAMQDILWWLSPVRLLPWRGDGVERAGAGGMRLARRAALAAILGAAWAAAARSARAAGGRPLRPPGAIDEARFAGVCMRCGNCVRACPAAIIAPDPGGQGLAGLLAPVLRFTEDYCRENCTRCTQVCPSGALVELEPAEKQRAPFGLARVDMEICLLSDDRDCAICRSHCPYEAIRMVFSETEYTLTPVIDAEKCPGCGACEVACPTTPVKAIVIYPRADGR